MQALEQRLLEKIDQRIELTTSKVLTLETALENQKQHFEQLHLNTENTCLWRIKDAEELIKSRVTNVALEAQLQKQQNQFSRQLSDHHKDHTALLQTKLQEAKDNLSQILDFSDQKYQDCLGRC